MEWDKGWKGFVFDPGLCQNKWWSSRWPEDKDISQKIKISHTLWSQFIVGFFLSWYNVTFSLCIWSPLYWIHDWTCLAPPKKWKAQNMFTTFSLLISTLKFMTFSACKQQEYLGILPISKALENTHVKNIVKKVKKI